MTGPSKKSVPRWTGPYRVVKCESDWDFVIEHLVTGKTFHSHSSRLKFYCDQDLNVTVDLKQQITHDEMRFKVKSILGHDLIDGEFKFLIHWLGFDEEDSTWEPIRIIQEDLPELVRNYVENLDETDKFKGNLLRSLV
jgi:hypothetical protein